MKIKNDQPSKLMLEMFPYVPWIKIGQDKYKIEIRTHLKRKNYSPRMQIIIKTKKELINYLFNYKKTYFKLSKPKLDERIKIISDGRKIIDSLNLHY